MWLFTSPTAFVSLLLAQVYSIQAIAHHSGSFQTVALVVLVVCALFSLMHYTLYHHPSAASWALGVYALAVVPYLSFPYAIMAGCLAVIGFGVALLRSSYFSPIKDSHAV